MYLPWDNVLDFKTSLLWLWFKPRMVCSLFMPLEMEGTGLTVACLSIGKTTRAALEDLGTVFPCKRLKWQLDVWEGSEISRGWTVKCSVPRRKIRFPRYTRTCLGRLVRYPTPPQPLSFKNPSSHWFGNLPRETWTSSFFLAKGREWCAGGFGTRGDVESSVFVFWFCRCFGQVFYTCELWFPVFKSGLTPLPSPKEGFVKRRGPVIKNATKM